MAEPAEPAVRAPARDNDAGALAEVDNDDNDNGGEGAADDLRNDRDERDGDRGDDDEQREVVHLRSLTPAQIHDIIHQSQQNYYHHHHHNNTYPSNAAADLGPIPRDHSRASMGARTSDSWIVLDETGASFSRASSRASERELGEFSEGYAHEMLPIRRTPDAAFAARHRDHHEVCYDSIAQAEQSLGMALQRESNLARLGSPCSVATDASAGPDDEINAAAAAAAAVARNLRFGERPPPFIGVMVPETLPLSPGAADAVQPSYSRPLSSVRSSASPRAGPSASAAGTDFERGDCPAWFQAHLQQSQGRPHLAHGSPMRNFARSRGTDDDALSAASSRRCLDHRYEVSSAASSPHFQRGEKSDRGERRRQRRECRAKLAKVAPDSAIWIGWLSITRVLEFLSAPLFVSHFCVLTFGVVVGRSTLASRALMYII